MPRNMLMAFVEEMGHEYENLLEGAAPDFPDATEGDREIALKAATSQMNASTNQAGDSCDEESDDDSDGNESAGDSDW